MSLDLEKLNAEFKEKSAEEIVRWVFSLKKKTVLTTNFGPHEAAIIYMVTRVAPDVPVVWIDSGYNTRATYRLAHRLIEEWKLNMRIYIPQLSSAYRDVIMNGIPEVNNPLHEEFTRQVKLEPFQRAMSELKPGVWITAIRKDQTLFRQSLNVLTESGDGVLKVAPIFYWSLKQLEDYMKANNLPIEKDYYDPTKVLENRECGLHLPSKKKQS